MAHRLVDVADDDPDLAHRPEQAAHRGSSSICKAGTVTPPPPRSKLPQLTGGLHCLT
jgi:hypothetical protein